MNIEQAIRCAKIGKILPIAINEFNDFHIHSEIKILGQGGL